MTDATGLAAPQDPINLIGASPGVPEATAHAPAETIDCGRVYERADGWTGARLMKGRRWRKTIGSR